jgi:hypothetical protein
VFPPPLLTIAPGSQVWLSRGVIEAARGVACEVEASGRLVATDVRITGCSRAAVSCRGGTARLEHAHIAGNSRGVVCSGSGSVRLASCHFSSNAQSNVEAAGSCSVELLDTHLDCAEGARSIVASDSSRVDCRSTEHSGRGGGEALTIGGEAAVASITNCTFSGVRVACSVSAGGRLGLLHCVLAHCGALPTPGGAYGAGLSTADCGPPDASKHTNATSRRIDLNNEGESVPVAQNAGQEHAQGEDMVALQQVPDPARRPCTCENQGHAPNGTEEGESTCVAQQIEGGLGVGSSAPRQSCGVPPDRHSCAVKQSWEQSPVGGLHACVLVSDRGSHADIKSCRFVSNLGGSVSVCKAATLHVEDCAASSGVGGASFEASGEGTILEMRSTQLHGAAGAAVMLTHGAKGDFSGLRVECCSVALHAAGAGCATVVDSAVLRCRWGILVDSAAQATATRVSFTDSCQSSAAVRGPRSQLTLETCTFSGSQGDHLACHSGGSLLIANSSVAGSLKSALRANGAATSVRAVDTEIHDVGGSALDISDAATGVLQKCLIRDCCGAVTATGAKTKASVDGCSFTRCRTAVSASAASSVHFTHTKCEDIGSTALHAESGALLEVSSSSVQRCGGGFIEVNAGGTVTVEDTHLMSCVGTGIFGDGAKASVQCSRCQIDMASGGAVWCRGGGQISCKDTLIWHSGAWAVRAAGTLTELKLLKCSVQQTAACALVAEQSAQLAVEECEIVGTESGSALVVDSNARVSMAASSLSSSHASVCSIRDAGSVACKDSTLKGSIAGCGVQVCEGGTFDGEKVEISGHHEQGVLQIGASLVTLKECWCVAGNIRMLFST